MAAVDYEQIARFYDVLVTTEDDIPFFTDLSRQACGKVLELMAGTGRVSIPVAAAGADLTCVDSSPAMLKRLSRKLKGRGLHADVERQDLVELDLHARFSLAFIAFNSFEELTTDTARESALRRVFAHLVPGGRFVCTLHDPGQRLLHVGAGRVIRRRFQDPDSGRPVEISVRTEYDERTSLVRGREQFKDLETVSLVADLPLCFRLTVRGEFESLVRPIGFHVEALYGGFDFSPYVEGSSESMVWVLSRPQ
jgi:SAM-dependent methyltransferase